MSHLPPPILVTTSNQMERLVNDLRGQSVVGIDTESNSLYAYHERICLIQLSTPGADYIVDPLSRVDISQLSGLFADPECQKVFHAANQDVAGLKRDYGFEFVNLFDTMWAARILGWARLGLGDLLEEHFGVHTNKRYQRHNWGKRPLLPEALVYARLDTHYLPSLRDLQMAELERLGRAAEASEVFDQITATEPATPSFGPDSFWRVKGVHDLSEREQAVLWEVYVWRDREASRRDRPPFKVVSDRTLTQIAIDRPQTAQALLRMPGLKQYHVRRYGDQILRAVRRGLDAPPPEPPPPPPFHTEAERERCSALRVWRKQVAGRRGVEPDVVISNATMHILAERAPTTKQDLEDIEGLGPWKQRHYGADLLRVLQPHPKRRRKRSPRSRR